MKKRIPTFLAGMLTTAIIGSLAVGTLAATGALTIEVNPINVQVNGQTFQPKDAKGNDVPVFAYNGTTYAPLRALAEAYGLEVGYDKEKNMATVGEKGSTAPETPDKPVGDYSNWTAEEEQAYQEFKGMWKEVDTADLPKFNIVNVRHIENTDGATQLETWLKSTGEATVKKVSKRHSDNIYAEYIKPLRGDKWGVYTVCYDININGKIIGLWSDYWSTESEMRASYNEQAVMLTFDATE